MSTVPSYGDLGSDSGPLLGIHGRRERAGRYYALALVFSNGVMTVRCDGDTDEVLVTVDPEVPDGMPRVEQEDDLERA